MVNNLIINVVKIHLIPTHIPPSINYCILSNPTLEKLQQ